MNVPVGNMTKKSDLLAQAKKLAAFGKRKSVKQIGRKVDIQKVYNELDEEDRRLADDYSLKEKVKSGVEVRLLYDSVGSKSLKKGKLKDAIDAGVKIGEFFPSLLKIVNITFYQFYAISFSSPTLTSLKLG